MTSHGKRVPHHTVTSCLVHMQAAHCSCPCTPLQCTAKCLVSPGPHLKKATTRTRRAMPRHASSKYAKFSSRSLQRQQFQVLTRHDTANNQHCCNSPLLLLLLPQQDHAPLITTCSFATSTTTPHNLHTSTGLWGNSSDLSACLASTPASRSRVAKPERARTEYAGAATSRADLHTACCLLYVCRSGYARHPIRSSPPCTKLFINPAAYYDDQTDPWQSGLNAGLLRGLSPDIRSSWNRLGHLLFR